MVLRYPYNLYSAMGLKSATGNITDIDNDDLILEFSKKGYLNENVASVLTKKYKEYKTLEGIAIECDLESEEVESFSEEGLNILMNGLSFAKKTKFWTKFSRSIYVDSLPISDKAKKTLSLKGYTTVGDIKMDPSGVSAVKVADEESYLRMIDILKNTPIGNTTYVVIRGDISRDNSLVEGVFVEKGRSLKLYKGILEDIKKCVKNVVDASIDKGGVEEKENDKEGIKAVKTSKLSNNEEIFRVTDEIQRSDPLSKYLTYNKYKVLFDKGIFSLEDVSQYSREDLLGLPGLGKRSLDVLEDYLGKVGLSFKKVSSLELPVKRDSEDTTSMIKSEDLPNVKDSLYFEESSDERLPDGFLVYARGRCDINMAQVSVGEIVELYGNYLQEAMREDSYWVYEKAISALKDKTPVNIINVLEKYKDAIFDDKAQTGRLESLCFSYYIKLYYKRLSKNSKAKRFFDQLCKQVISVDKVLDMNSIVEFCNCVKSPVSLDVCRKVYTEVYKKDKDLGRELVGETRGTSYGKYTENLGYLCNEIRVLGLSESLASVVDEWCKARRVSYDGILSKVRALVKKVNSGVLKYAYVEEAVEDLLVLYNGDYGLMSVVSEKFPKYK